MPVIQASAVRSVNAAGIMQRIFENPVFHLILKQDKIAG